MNDTGEFYVGYLERSPPELARFVRRAVLGLAVLLAAMAGFLTLGQRPLPATVFEFGTTRTLRGLLREHPYPTLSLAIPRGGGSSATLLLSAPGKHGAGPLVAGLDGKLVELDGKLATDGERAMLEVVPGSAHAVEPAPGETLPDAAAPVSLGERTLVGEIVDSKCFLGVMNPSVDKTHRSCATLCIRGGIPPILVARDASGAVQKLLLVDREGRPVNERVLDLVADTVEITGAVELHDDLLVLKADPATYERLD